MNPVTYAFGIVAAVLALAAIIELMRRGTLRERHAVWWFVGGVLALIIAVFPQTLTWAAKTLGISIPTNLVFFIAIGLLFLVSLQYGAELTRIEEKLRTLAEHSAFQEYRIAQLERRFSGADSGRPDAGEEDEAQ
ncbi:DUF2304 domain-containing protein [Microbacterium sp. M28]|uniref:DUF2304 domain-containing protein n=1 Tax=Microbacterium sp. M28 TaxID=2962064 RepID=UPI0021F476A8|nr:DUF2304 domain-containing protein [Microbacterium sp. M28]UYO98156.1 DUF2304 domain-containing protein [Microbacterium sp. M28]